MTASHSENAQDRLSEIIGDDKSHSGRLTGPLAGGLVWCVPRGVDKAERQENAVSKLREILDTENPLLCSRAKRAR